MVLKIKNEISLVDLFSINTFIIGFSAVEIVSGNDINICLSYNLLKLKYIRIYKHYLDENPFCFIFSSFCSCFILFHQHSLFFIFYPYGITHTHCTVQYFCALLPKCESP